MNVFLEHTNDTKADGKEKFLKIRKRKAHLREHILFTNYYKTRDRKGHWENYRTVSFCAH